MDTDLVVQKQDVHPTQYDVDLEANAGNAPKADAGDSGATVGTPGSAATAVADIGAAVAGVVNTPNGQGYSGHNPDPNDNDFYTVAGVTSQRQARVDAGLEVAAPTPGVSEAPKAKEDVAPVEEPKKARAKRR